MTELSIQNSGRKVYFDVLRIFATFAVLFNHTSTKGYALVTIANESPFSLIYLLCSVLCKVAVPIFLMISGALLLKKEELVSVILKKRFLKFLIILFVSSLILRFYLINGDISKFTFVGFIKKFYSSSISTNLWYLYAYLAYILTLPFLRKMASKMQTKDYIYMIILMTIIPLLKCMELLVFDYEVHLHSRFSFFTTTNIVFYPLVGDFLANKLTDDKVNKKTVLISCGIGIFFIIVSCVFTYLWCGHLGEWKYETFEGFIDRFVFYPAISIFILARYLFMKINLNKIVEKCIIHTGSCTFGIYLFERIYRQETLFIFDWLNQYIPRFIACLIWIFVAFLVGLLITSILKKIPIIKKYI